MQSDQQRNEAAPMPESTPELTQDQWVQIQEHIAGGKMITAIKLYREITGVGLKQAKDAVEAYAEKLPSEAPERYPLKSKSGCAGAIVLCAMGLAATLATLSAGAKLAGWI
jgi:ribosomal protein L7/L12